MRSIPVRHVSRLLAGCTLLLGCASDPVKMFQTDPAVRPKAASFEYRYSALADDPAQIAAPTTEACLDPDGWNSLCRVIINYETHIQPLWEREREPMTVTDPELAIARTANTCVACHSPTDADGNLQVPAMQLNLLRAKENANTE